ncbi:S66 peptidase family protein [Pseudomonas gingeri]|uniref:LD-carboxypeptidase n=2 Tax=Pseudomonas gingeri TaxID=117681 RepID=A0A7Y8CK11_9PSED|nr:LD-carboxypeptidase [Pseudomonas gingeri]NWA02819.1 LD-carboxypeptidase [Pseudomonas gingeri]NWA16982.1 LD-carboxypeptidase [Pseudomonas gingeri]NWA58433.1 LD-carboxypeptidase [Pseudomonas gingeri]NWA97827.1 LD-carboxypeptidase [Pseudomonas gingeri]NWB06089.1 LD-carboxypeptidase [Pseudomonas gingeri]
MSSRRPVQAPYPVQSAVSALPGGGVIGLIAPAGPVALDPLKAQQWAQARGYELRIFPGVLQRDGYLAGTDEVRLQDLHDAFADPEIDAILCLRGGYGCPRLLDKIDYDLLKKHPKILVGYSDITALHLAIARYAGFMTFHGPMFNIDLLGDKQPPTESSLLNLLTGHVRAGDVLQHPDAYPLTTVIPGVASGLLQGGNLSLICASLGTAYEIDTDGVILLIEDVNEPLYRVDRLLTHLRLAGKLEGLKGVLVGDFAGVDADALARLLKQELGALGIPVLAGWRSGHCDPNLTLPLGAQVRLDADARQLVLEQDVVLIA